MPGSKTTRLAGCVVAADAASRTAAPTFQALVGLVQRLPIILQLPWVLIPPEVAADLLVKEVQRAPCTGQPQHWHSVGGTPEQARCRPPRGADNLTLPSRNAAHGIVVAPAG